MFKKRAFMIEIRTKKKKKTVYWAYMNWQPIMGSYTSKNDTLTKNTRL